MFESADYSDLPQFGVGHAQDERAATGCSVFLAFEGAACGVDVRGGGPATRETDLLRPENMVQEVNAVVLSGGSAFGLESACGAMERLSEENMGFAVAGLHVPIVPAACIFDLLVGEASWPDKQMGAEACTRALRNSKVNPEQGNVGAGTGATVGKIGPAELAMKSGFGWCGLRSGGLVVIANVVVNAAGNVNDGHGQWIAGALSQDKGSVREPLEALADMATALSGEQGHTTNTTIGVILTNAKLDKAQATKVSQISHDAYARAIKPVHTLNDGDTIFTMAHGNAEAPLDMVCVMATEAMEGAIRNAIRKSASAYGLLCASDL